jgi:hypothetical protein
LVADFAADFAAPWVALAELGERLLVRLGLEAQEVQKKVQRQMLPAQSAWCCMLHTGIS